MCFLKSKFVTFKNLNCMKENNYAIPEIEVLEIFSEGVLCGSDEPGLDMNPEEGIM